MVSPLPSSSSCVNVGDAERFMCGGLSSHKFTLMPRVYHGIQEDTADASLIPRFDQRRNETIHALQFQI